MARPRKRQKRVSVSDVAVVVAEHERRLKRLERKDHERRQQREPAIGFRVEQDDEDADYTPDEVRRR